MNFFVRRTEFQITPDGPSVWCVLVVGGASNGGPWGCTLACEPFLPSEASEISVQFRSLETPSRGRSEAQGLAPGGPPQMGSG